LFSFCNAANSKIIERDLRRRGACDGDASELSEVDKSLALLFFKSGTPFLNRRGDTCSSLDDDSGEESGGWEAAVRVSDETDNFFPGDEELFCSAVVVVVGDVETAMGAGIGTEGGTVGRTDGGMEMGRGGGTGTGREVTVDVEEDDDVAAKAEVEDSETADEFDDVDDDDVFVFD
jgi:hypothetical protein